MDIIWFLELRRNIWLQSKYVNIYVFWFCLRLQKDDKFMPSFRKSVGYVRLLAELDLLKDISKSDEEETRSLDELSLGESSSLCSFDVDDRDKNYNSPSEVGASSNVSDAPVRNSECTLTASICQKGRKRERYSFFRVVDV